MINDEIEKVLEIAYTKNWNDFFYLGFFLYSLGTFVFFLGWFKIPILLDYLLYLPEFIIGSIALGIYMVFTKSE